MTLADSGHLSVNGTSLEYRMIGPRPDAAPAIVMLHEGLGPGTTWGDFPQKLGEQTGAGVFVYSRAGYGQSSTITLPRPLDYMQREATEMLPALLDAIGFRRGILLGHSDGASIAACYAGSVQDHRVRGLVLIAPHFFTESEGLAAIRKARAAYATTDLRARLARLRSHRRARLHPRAGAGAAGRCRSVRHARAGPHRRRELHLPGRDRGAARRRPFAAARAAG